LNGAKASSPMSTESASKWTFPAYLVIKMIAILKKSGKTIPIAESLDNNLVCCKVSISQTVKTPTNVALTIKNGEFKSLTTKKAKTIPNQTVWVMASDSIVEPRRT